MATPWPSDAPPFADLARAYTRLIWSTARSAGVPDADVPDCAQEVFVKLYRAIVERGLDASRPLGGWLIRTTRSIARDLRRLKRTRMETLTTTGTSDPGEDTADQEARMTEAINVHRVIGRVLDKLPPDTLEVFVLGDLEGTPMSEIIEELGIPRATAYDRLKAGRKAFAREWEAMQKSGDEAVVPFALLGVEALAAAWRSTDDMPEGFEEDLLRRLHEQIGPDFGGPASGTVRTGEAGPARAGRVALKRVRLGASHLLAGIAGAVLYALLTRAPPPPAPSTGITTTTSAAVPVGPAAPTANTATSLAPTVAPPDGTASATPPESQEKLLDSARALLRDHKPENALALLARVTAPEFAMERDKLRRNALSAAGR
jgi:RNA polymerase sigma-70 factor (ECF subfamily)